MDTCLGKLIKLWHILWEEYSRIEMRINNDTFVKNIISKGLNIQNKTNEMKSQ